MNFDKPIILVSVYTRMNFQVRDRLILYITDGNKSKAAKLLAGCSEDTIEAVLINCIQYGRNADAKFIITEGYSSVKTNQKVIKDAVKYNRNAVLDYLLPRAKVSEMEKSSEYITIAMENENIWAVEKLLKYPTFQPTNLGKVLEAGVRSRSRDPISKLLMDWGESAEIPPIDIGDALILAVREGDTQIIERMLASTKTFYTGHAYADAIDWAVFSRSPTVLTQLLTASPHADIYDGFDPLVRAINTRDESIIDILLDDPRAKPMRNLACARGVSAVEHAIEWDSLTSVRVLQHPTVQLDTDVASNHLLLLAIKANNLHVTEYILEKGTPLGPLTISAAVEQKGRILQAIIPYVDMKKIEHVQLLRPKQVADVIVPELTQLRAQVAAIKAAIEN